MTRVVVARMRGLGVWGVVLGLFVSLGVLVVPGVAFGEEGECSTCRPWWRLSESVRPSVLAPGGEGTIVVQADNLGDAPTSSGAVTVSDVLPAGLSVVEVAGEPEVSFSHLPVGPGAGCTVVGRRVSCTAPEGFPPLLPYELYELTVVVRAAGAPSVEANAAEVSGGGAPAVRVTRPVTTSSVAPVFGSEGYQLVPEEEGGGVDAQAGSHPFQLTSTFALNQTADSLSPPALVRNLRFKLPPGLVGNALAVPQCSEELFSKIQSYQNFCPVDTVVGVALVTVLEPRFGNHVQTWPIPLYNLVPARGEPARFGFTVVKTPVTIDTSVRTGADYGVVATVSNTSEVVNFFSSTVVFWGDPGDARHNTARGWCIGGGFHNITEQPCSQSTQGPVSAPFLTLPTSCQAPFVSSVEGESWPRETSPGSPLTTASFSEGSPNSSYSLEDQFGRALGITGCDELQFGPSIAVRPDVAQASTSTGLRVDVHVPQEVSEDPAGLAGSSVKDITVALPAGVAVNPSSGNGLEACSEPEIGFQGTHEYNPQTEPGNLTDVFSPTLPEPLLPGLGLGALGFCPDASKIATVEIHSPLIKDPLKGFVYLASQNQNPFGSLIAAYIVAEDPVSGTLVKLPGLVRACETTGETISGETCATPGQLISTFQNNPQLPFEDAELHFFGGERAPLATPARCGEYTTNASFVPWAAEASDQAQATRTASSTFQVTTGPNKSVCPGATLPFSPSLTGGTTNINAGAFSPLTTTIGREDGEQDLQSVTLHTPAGLEGMLSNVKLCPETQANEGTCPPESQIGETTVSAGVGSDPVAVQGGRVYLTEKYAGAPFGLSIVNPVKAGPFDLEHDTSNPNQNPACDCLVVRAKIVVDPHTAELTVTTDPTGPHAIPHQIDGIPVQIKKINVTINRPHFTFNPTNCSPLNITSTLTGTENTSTPLSVPFQVTNCALLKYTPTVTVTTNAHTSKANGASLNFKIAYPKNSMGTQANFRYAKFALPKQLPARLTTLQKACLASVFDTNPANCPTGSLIGHAIVHTPVLPVPLQGPVYFVSHGGAKFPDAIIVLQGYGITINLIGETFINKQGITSATFANTPDVPFQTIEVNIPPGPHGEFAANLPPKAHGNLCGQKLTIPTHLIAQNNQQITQNTPIHITGCHKKHKHKHHKKH